MAGPAPSSSAWPKSSNGSAGRWGGGCAGGPESTAITALRTFRGVNVEVEQDAGAHAFALAHQAEQDVLGADVVVTERECLAQRELEHLLRGRGERDLAGGDLLAGPDQADHLSTNALDRDVE